MGCQRRYIISLVMVTTLISLCSVLAWHFISNTEEDNCTENRIPVSSSHQLRKALERSAKCDVIELLDKEYDIDFSILIKSRISLEGCGSNQTLLRVRHNRENDTNAALSINGHNSSITGVKIVMIENVDWTSGINIRGQGNTIKDIQFSGMHYRKKQTITPMPTEESLFCVKLDGDENQVDSITCSQVPNGILVNGNMNKLKKLQYLKTSGGEESVAVQISEGTENEVDDLRCEGLDRNDWGVLLQSGTKKAKILNAKCGPVWVNGEGATLSNVNAKEYFRIEGSGHKLENVEAVILTSEESLVGSTNISFNYTTQRVKVNNSDQFFKALEEARERDVIELGAGDYAIDRAILVPPGVLVEGAGSNATIFRFNISANDDVKMTLELQNNSEVSGLTLLGLGNIDVVIRVSGTSNTLRDIYFHGIDGIKSRPVPCIRVHGDRNRLESVICSNFRHGVFVRGKMNTLKNVRYSKPPWSVGSVAVELSDGSGNVVDGLMCEGLTIAAGDMGLSITSRSKEGRISNGVCGPVVVRGNETMLFNWDAGEYLKVEGIGHRSENVRAKMYINGGTDVQAINTTFEKTELAIKLKDRIDLAMGEDVSTNKPTMGVKTADELKNALKDVVKGTVIELAEGAPKPYYKGPLW